MNNSMHILGGNIKVNKTECFKVFKVKEIIKNLQTLI